MLSCLSLKTDGVDAPRYLPPLLIVRDAGRGYEALAFCAHAFTSSLDFHLNPSALCALQHFLPQEAQTSTASLMICCPPEIKCPIVQLWGETYVMLAALLSHKLNSCRAYPVVFESRQVASVI